VKNPPRENSDTDFDLALDNDCLANLAAMIDLPVDLIKWLQDQREATGVSVASQVGYAIAAVRQLKEAARSQPAPVIAPDSKRLRSKRLH
jgi:hypothetical protein